MAEGKPTMTLTHYTDESSAEQILESGRINPSTEDAVCGRGTYMISVPPSEGKEQIATNNYGHNSWTSLEKEKEGKVDEGKPMMTLIHYTDKSSAERILESGRINPSTEDALCGPGTYMTKVPPSEGKEQIAANNYGHNSWTSQQKMKEGKVDVAITVQVPAEDVTRLTKHPDVEGRSVYNAEKGLDLTKLDYKVDTVPDKPRHH